MLYGSINCGYIRILAFMKKPQF